MIDIADTATDDFGNDILLRQIKSATAGAENSTADPEGLPAAQFPALPESGKRKKLPAVLPVTVPPGAVLPAAVQRYLRIPCTISVLSRKNRMTPRKRMTKNSWNVRRADHPDRRRLLFRNLQRILLLLPAIPARSRIPVLFPQNLICPRSASRFPQKYRKSIAIPRNTPTTFDK